MALLQNTNWTPTRQPDSVIQKAIQVFIQESSRVYRLEADAVRKNGALGITVEAANAAIKGLIAKTHHALSASKAGVAPMTGSDAVDVNNLGLFFREQGYAWIIDTSRVGQKVIVNCILDKLGKPTEYNIPSFEFRGLTQPVITTPAINKYPVYPVQQSIVKPFLQSGFVTLKGGAQIERSESSVYNLTEGNKPATLVVFRPNGKTAFPEEYIRGELGHVVFANFLKDKVVANSFSLETAYGRLRVGVQDINEAFSDLFMIAQAPSSATAHYLRLQNINVREHPNYALTTRIVDLTTRELLSKADNNLMYVEAKKKLGENLQWESSKDITAFIQANPEMNQYLFNRLIFRYNQTLELCFK